METWFFGFVQSFTGKTLLDQLMVFFAEFLVVLVPLTLLYLWFQGEKGRGDSVYTFIAVVSGLITSYAVLAQLYQHQSPFQIYDTIAAGEPENSFPSQHTTVMLSMILPLFYRKRRKLGVLTLVAGLITGFSRIYIGEHFLLDIMGAGMAALIGFAALLLSERYLGTQIKSLIGLAYRVQKKVFSYLPFNLESS